MSRHDAPHDPTAAFTDMQWYMYRQGNVAFFGAYTGKALDSEDLLALARGVVARAPQLRTGYAGALPDEPLADAILVRLIHKESVDTLDGFPDRWFDAGAAIFAAPGLPLFRLRYAVLANATPEGPQGFLLVQLAHALAEGADSALLSRSRSRPHAAVRSPRVSAFVAASAWIAGTLLPPFHLLAAHMAGGRPGRYSYASRTVLRADLTAAARSFGVRQRALLYALAMQTLFDPSAPDAQRRISAAYSSLATGATSGDSFIRMRMLFARFINRPDLAAFARAVDARLAAGETRETGFNAAMNARGVHMHRRLARLVPFAYGPRLFRFTPFDIVLALLPPHRLAGPLARDLTEPIYAGAALQGVNACVIVPARLFVTFNFHVEERLRARVARLDRLLAAVRPRSSGHL